MTPPPRRPQARLSSPPPRSLWMDTCLWPASTPGGSSSPVPTLVAEKWSLRDSRVCLAPWGSWGGASARQRRLARDGGASLQGPTENRRQ